MMHRYLYTVFVFLALVVGGQDAFSQDTVEYIVRSGDCAGKIAEKYGMGLSEFKSLNHMSDTEADKIREGQKVRVIDKRQRTRADEAAESTVCVGNENAEAAVLRESKASDSDHSGRSRTKESRDVYQDTHRDSTKGKSAPLNRPVLIFALLLVFASIVWRMRFWDKLTVKNKTVVFRVTLIAGILLAVLSWCVMRKVLLVLCVVAAVVAVSFYLTKKFGGAHNRQARSASQMENDSLSRDKTADSRIISDPSESDRVGDEQLRRDNERLKQENEKLKKKVDEFIDENIQLGKQIEELKSKINSLSSPSCGAAKPMSREADCTGVSVTEGKLYAESILNGTLMRVAAKISNDTIFELDLRGKDTAVLTVLPDAYHRILANAAFIDGCDKQVIGNTNVKVTPGEAVCNAQGKWIVTKKPEVIIS